MNAEGEFGTTPSFFTTMTPPGETPSAPNRDRL